MRYAIFCSVILTLALASVYSHPTSFTTLYEQPASSPSPQAPLGLPVEMMVPIAPTPVKGEGKNHLAYELHLTNFDTKELTLVRLEVFDGDGKLFAQYEGKEFIDRLARPGVPPNTEKQKLGGGLRAVVFLWLTFDSPSTVPATLRHRLITKINVASEGKTSEIEVKGEGAEVKVRNTLPLVISPPLRGERWFAGNGPSNTSGHRRSLVPFSGAARFPERFAIDWVQLSETGQTFTGDQLKNENHHCYGAEVLAVADATVIAVKDGIPENIPGVNSRAVPITLETVRGNHVVLDLGGGYFALYNHLQPGRLRIKVGDKVKRGQVLGLIGNSGNSTGPHLHFQINDAKPVTAEGLPYVAEGLPYVFESFEVQGKGRGWTPSDKDVAAKRQMEIPMQDAVVRFTGRR